VNGHSRQRERDELSAGIVLAICALVTVIAANAVGVYVASAVLLIASIWILLR
jgi:hypothetical protein